MDHRVQWGGDPEDIYVQAYGKATLAGLDAMTQEALADPRFRPGMKILLDYALLDWSGMSAQDVRARAAAAVRIGRQLGDARIAIIVGRPVEFGVGRMAQAYTEESLAAEIGLFYSAEEAREWLRNERDQAG